MGPGVIDLWYNVCTINFAIDGFTFKHLSFNDTNTRAWTCFTYRKLYNVIGDLKVTSSI